MSLDKNSYNLLLEQDYNISKLLMYNYGDNLKLYIEFSDKDLLDFKSKLVLLNLSTINLNLNPKSNNINILSFDVNCEEFIGFPKNTYEISYICYICYITFENILNNLPANLIKLYIKGVDFSSNNINLNNLPSNLMYLRIEGTKINLNLNYLPESLKILDIDDIYNKLTLEDICNLPKSLEEIFINGKNYNSVNELVNSFI